MPIYIQVKMDQTFSSTRTFRRLQFPIEIYTNKSKTIHLQIITLKIMIKATSQIKLDLTMALINQNPATELN